MTLGVHGVVVRHGVDAVSRVNVRRAGRGVDVNIGEASGELRVGLMLAGSNCHGSAMVGCVIY